MLAGHHADIVGIYACDPHNQVCDLMGKASMVSGSSDGIVMVWDLIKDRSPQCGEHLLPRALLL